jgi:hypothetical protein
MKKHKEPKNSKGQYHGYHELNWNNKMWFRGYYKHGITIGYTEEHFIYLIKKSIYYIR